MEMKVLFLADALAHSVTVPFAVNISELILRQNWEISTELTEFGKFGKLTSLHIP